MFDLKRFRKDKKINQATLAKQLGVGQSFISQIESGKDPMPDSLVESLGVLFPGVNMREYIAEAVNVNSSNNDLVDIIKSQQDTINRQSKIIEALTVK